MTRPREPQMPEIIGRLKRRRGNTVVLAEAMHITSQAVSQWKRVPAKHVLDVERLTGISRYELRPDIFGAGPDAERAA